MGASEVPFYGQWSPISRSSDAHLNKSTAWNGYNSSNHGYVEFPAVGPKSPFFFSSFGPYLDLPLIYRVLSCEFEPGLGCF